jgi:hypothetical protein
MTNHPLSLLSVLGQSDAPAQVIGPVEIFAIGATGTSVTSARALDRHRRPSGEQLIFDIHRAEPATDTDTDWYLPEAA